MLKAESDFDPTETPTGKYKAGKIRDRNINAIIEAAAEEFVQNGFKGTSIQAIADRADIPKANVHYYFKSKSNLYIAVIDNLLQLWNDFFNTINEDDDPAVELDQFIRQKVMMSYTHPRSSKLFAMEIIQGAPHLKEYLRSDLRQWVRERAKVIDSWIAQGKMDKVDPAYLIFLIWSSTQHYADFDTQVLTLMNRAEFELDMIEGISNFLSSVILKGCGLTPPTKS
ncbi:TetR/AcrR family transcriptional regulator [Echinimonas agarilytica]|uniref:TetR/AcrR family transcriptional regulator n=1 Tax=Echinimonas agarilytica TaxID=1215918 RepID=A0AA41W3I9_9GAMM|nr:TetR/AcrR family transcriptional regulator [Echinimonas agarilytica]MCM2678139.1 TetR/AcrR family transcriptional regulator [Echinimonas agarilytica]